MNVNMRSETKKTQKDSKDLSSVFYSDDFCDTDLLVLSCVKTPPNEVLEEDFANILHDIAGDATNNKNFNLQFGRFKIYKDKRIALRATLKGKAVSVKQKIDYLDETKNILINSHKSIFKPFEFCEIPIVLIVIYNLGDNTNAVREELIKKREEAGIRTDYTRLGGIANFITVYNKEEFIVLSPLQREKSYFSAMDLIYNIAEETYIQNGNVIFDSDVILDGLNKYRDKGLEIQSSIRVVSIWKVITTALLFVAAVPLLLIFINYSINNKMYIYGIGGIFMIISLLPISLDYYYKITSNKYLVKIGRRVL